MPPFKPYLSTRWRWVVYFPSLPLKPLDRTPLLILKETEWAPEPVWTFRKRGRCLPLPGFEHKSVRPALGRFSHAMYTLRDLQYSQKTVPICKSPPAPDCNKTNQAVPAVRMRTDWTDHFVTDTCMCSERVLPSLTESNHISRHTDTRYAYTVEFMLYGKGRV
jgi:hypothetical protein